MDPVDATVREWRQTRHIWGQSDCLLSMARYFASLGLPNVLPIYAGTYDTAETAARLLEEHGGFARAMETMGADPVAGHPRRGDAVGLCYGDHGLIAGLCTGDMVAARLERGVVEAPLRLIQWSGVWRGRC